MLYGKGLFFSKPKVAKKINGVNNQCQKVGSPIRPLATIHFKQPSAPPAEGNTALESAIR